MTLFHKKRFLFLLIKLSGIRSLCQLGGIASCLSLLVHSSFGQTSAAQANRPDTPLFTTHPMTGTINCAESKVVGTLTGGVSSEVRLDLVVDVATTGPNILIVLSNSFRPLTASLIRISASKTGLQTFSIPLMYKGLAANEGSYFIQGLGNCLFR